MTSMTKAGLTTKIETDKIVDKKVLGVAVGHKNNVTDKIIFGKILQNTNEKQKVIKAAEFN